jgi:hypothetical protein
MCKFFSLVSDGKGKVFYCDNVKREELLKSNPTSLEPDSHTSICSINGISDDKVNKYEYNPLLKTFTVDQINVKDDSEEIKKFCEKLDFRLIVPELIIKPVIHPFKDVKCGRITKKDMVLLAQWASVGDSVWASVRASVGDSVWAETSSFFNLPKWKYIEHEEGKNPFQPCIDLWERGIVPSFDGKIWRLHTPKGIAKEITVTELKKIKIK